MFILASSVCKSLQYLTSALTQGGEGDHLLRLICSIALRGGRNTTNKYQWHDTTNKYHLQCLGHTGFAPTHGMCAFSVYAVQAPGCSAGELSKVGAGLPTLPRSMPLRFRFSSTPTKAQTQLGLRFVPFPGPSSLADQVLGQHTLPSWAVHLITSPVPATGFPGCAVGAPSQVCRVSLLGC